MMACWNSCKKTLKDSEQLFSQADQGYCYLGAQLPESNVMWVIEAGWSKTHVLMAFGMLLYDA